MESSPIVAVLSDDLIFSSRIAAVAQVNGAMAHTSRNAEQLLASAQAAPPACVIIDLAIVGPQLAELLSALALPAQPRVIAYGPHVDAAQLKSAAEAGCDVVLPRSKFVEALDRELPQWLAPRA
jgi:DNA-binding NarL/FixJ family response regulator